tara:strand:- start:461 stop:655 length:195 start_codon:yes stop_codon:yes gene_type:complete
MKVSGWYESDYGVSFFDYEADTLKQIAKEMLQEFHDDCVGVDLEAIDQDSKDVSKDLATLLRHI